jgi:photosystem II stability/assembly factor-like uncharacterized protein
MQRMGSVAGRLTAVVVAMTALASTSYAQTASRRWGGLVHDAFTLDGQEVWVVEDGGRIRHRSVSGVWTVQTTPIEAEDTLRRIQFLGNGLNGWAVSNGGWVLCTTNGGVTWATMPPRIPAVIGAGWEDLWDIHFISATEGWLVGLHALWHTTNGGQTWTAATLLDSLGQPITGDALEHIELYAIDIVGGGPSPMLGLASAEPGWIFRATDPLVWQVVFEVEDLCPTPPAACSTIFSANQLTECGCDKICAAGLAFEPWDIEISRHPTEKLAICAGGIGPDCGLILASLDDGLTWALEPHECGNGTNCGLMGPNGPLYNPPGTGGLWRHKEFLEIYGVSIAYDSTSSSVTSVACGYGGQHLVRDPSTPKWMDRSEYGNSFNPVPLGSTPPVTQPMFGTAIGASPSTGTRGVISGGGGYVRYTADAGQSWTTQQAGEPWRIRDVHFIDGLRGWMVGQFYRIARTIDGGANWSGDAPPAAFGQPFLNAIVIDSTGGIGMAVGDFDPSTGRPKIFFNDALTNPLIPWTPPVLIDVLPPTPTSAIELREVDWAGGLEFWAVGAQGLIYHSDPTLGPAQCAQFVPSGTGYDEFSTHEFHGVSFAGTNEGVFVGSRSTLGVESGKAYHYQRSGPNVSWTEIPITEPGIEVLTDVDFDGSVAYAVGLQSPRLGVVLRATYASGSFSSFTLVHTVAPCDVGDDVGEFPVLNEVEIDPGDNVWAAGECGRLWRNKSGTSSWSQVRSLTDSNVRGMSFPGADLGFLACHRGSRTGHVIVRVDP